MAYLWHSFNFTVRHLRLQSDHVIYINILFWKQWVSQARET